MEVIEMDEFGCILIYGFSFKTGKISIIKSFGTWQ